MQMRGHFSGKSSIYDSFDLKVKFADLCVTWCPSHVPSHSYLIFTFLK